MADLRRVIAFRFDVDNNRRTDSGDNVLRGRMEMHRKSFILFRVDLKRGDGEAFTPDPAAVWNANIDSVFDPTHADLAASDNTQFNIGGDRDDLDVGGGLISFRIDTTSTALEDDLGDEEEKVMFLELYMTPPAGSPSLLAQISFDMKNIVSDIGATSELVFSTTNLIRADGDDTVIFLPDGTEVQRFTP